MEELMVPYQLIFVGLSMASKINSSDKIQIKVFANQKKISSTTSEIRTNFLKEYFKVIISCVTLATISKNSITIPIL